MIELLTGERFAQQAQADKYTGIKYDNYDCQAFVELVLRDCDVRKPDGSIYNWKGSNDMWRNALAWKGTISECMQKYGNIPAGAWVFMVAHDGGEVKRGYHDNEGNASHVGIYCRPGNARAVRDSTKGTGRDGVGYRPLTDFTHIGLPFVISYDAEPSPVIDKTEALQALKTLTDFIERI